jgi:flagellar export protein FliJ
VNQHRLAAVLRVRELQEQIARGELARTNEQLRRATDAEARTWAWLDRPDAGRTVASQQLAAQQAFRDAGTLAAGSQRLITERAEDGVVVARDEWAVAARRVEGLERLAERTRDAEALDDDRRRSNEIDDLVLARRGREVAP